jgi:hypothetical protein
VPWATGPGNSYVVMRTIHVTKESARQRKSSLVVPGGLPVTEREEGDALTVLHTVVSDWGYRLPGIHGGYKNTLARWRPLLDQP